MFMAEGAPESRADIGNKQVAARRVHRAHRLGAKVPAVAVPKLRIKELAIQHVSHARATRCAAEVTPGTTEVTCVRENIRNVRTWSATYLLHFAACFTEYCSWAMRACKRGGTSTVEVCTVALEGRTSADATLIAAVWLQKHQTTSRSIVLKVSVRRAGGQGHRVLSAEKMALTCVGSHNNPECLDSALSRRSMHREYQA